MALDKVARASCLSPTWMSARLDELRRECCDHGLHLCCTEVRRGRGEGVVCGRGLEKRYHFTPYCSQELRRHREHPQPEDEGASRGVPAPLPRPLLSQLLPKERPSLPPQRRSRSEGICSARSEGGGEASVCGGTLGEGGERHSLHTEHSHPTRHAPPNTQLLCKLTARFFLHSHSSLISSCTWVG